MLIGSKVFFLYLDANDLFTASGKKKAHVVWASYFSNFLFITSELPHHFYQRNKKFLAPLTP